MKNNWFVKTGWVYLPVHFMGYLVTVMAIVFLIPVVASVIRNGHSASDDLCQLFVYVSCVAFWWNWIAVKTS